MNISREALAALAALDIGVRAELADTLVVTESALRNSAYWTKNKAAKQHVVGQADTICVIVSVLNEGDV